MKGDEAIAANLQAWEEAAPIHAKHNLAQQIEAFSDASYLALDEVQRRRLAAIGVEGKAVAQLCCNNGIELISIARLGAARCVGFDGAEGFLEQGRRIAEAAGAEVEFVGGDVNAISADFDGSFDLVVVTIGVLSWMPDLARFFGVAARLLRPGGVLFIHEQHPVVETVKPGGADDPVEFEWSYFSKEPFIDESGLDYYGGEVYGARPNYSFMHKMSDILMAGLGAGLRIEDFEERPEHISCTWWNVEAMEFGLPMSLVLEMRKE